MTVRLIAPLTADERRAFIDAARARVGTPFRHRGRTATGLDCIGLLVVALHAAGRVPVDRRTYGRAPDRDKLRETVREHFGPPVADMQPGDIVLMRWSDRPQHVALVGDYAHGGLSLIHADSSFGAVTEHNLAAPWVARIVETYRP